jgi:hypothetical protein
MIDIQNGLDLVNETEALDIAINYPFRASLITIARCGFCQQYGDSQYECWCKLHHKIHYPTHVDEHDCPDYQYHPHFVKAIPEDMIKDFMQLDPRLPECAKCFYQFHGYCAGLTSWPRGMKDGKCNDFLSASNRCKYAIQMFQWGDTIQNHYCSRPPEERDEEYARKHGWKCHCIHPLKQWHHECFTPQDNGDDYQ